MDSTYFTNIDSEEKAYWLGFIAADGCVYEKSSGSLSLCVGLSLKDESHLQKLKSALSFGGDLYHKSRTINGTTYGTVSLMIGTQDIPKDLIRHGITPRKSFSLKPWNGPHDLMRHYWRGLVDGDGWVIKMASGHWRTGLCGSEYIVNAFRQYVQRSGISGGSVAESKHCKGHYSVQYGGIALPRSVVSLIYKDAEIFLERKMEMAKELMAHEGELRTLFTYPDDSIIRQLYSSYHSFSKVASVLDISHWALYHHCVKRGMSARYMKTEFAA